ncbi:major facilitator superfamily domain-containing protein [Gaertneriomyces semiglobifer]|nr:major facilitator superfamily domain-containing protein [Gaertneriomyces semiglobifer]
MPLAEEYSVARRLALVALGTFAALTTAGVIFGFQALRPALIQSKVFADLCPEGEDGPCTPQLLRLNLMFTIASTGANLASLPIGLLLDAYGPRTTILTGSTLFLGGGLLFGFSSPDFDAYIPGFLLLGVGGPFCFIGCLHLSRAFPANAGTVMAALTGAFDASSSIYLFFDLIYSRFNGDIHTYFLYYSIVPISIALFTVLLMPKHSFGQASPGAHISDEERSLSEESEEQEDQPLLNNSSDHRLAESQALFWKQFRGLHFWGITATICIMMLRLNFYISSVEDQVREIAGGDEQRQIQSIVSYFNLALPAAGIVAIPAVGYLLDNYDFTTSLSVLWFLAMSFGIMGLVPNLPLQYVAVSLFVVMRPLLYTIGNDFCGKAFGFVTFGRLYGIMNILAGTVNLLQYLLNFIALDVMHHHFWAVNTENAQWISINTRSSTSSLKKLNKFSR